MWLNMRPYVNQPFNPVAVPYTIGISGSNDMIDQKRNVIRLKPGTQVLIRIIPRLIKTSQYFDGLTMNQRRCKLPSEADGLEYLKIYSRIGCETDCAIQNAISICHCIPWHYPNDFETWPICELFGGFCFDFFMSLSITYTTCKYKVRHKFLDTWNELLRVKWFISRKLWENTKWKKYHLHIWKLYSNQTNIASVAV